jgi:hypothetical protein
MAKRSKKLQEADKFRATVNRLRSLGEIFRDWEGDWLDSEAKRRDDYIYTDKERVVLNRIVAAARSFEGYGEYSVAELVRIAYRYKADLDPSGEEFVDRLCRTSTRSLPVRQLCRLVSIARMSEDTPWDEEVEIAMAETRARDEAIYEIPEFVPYPQGV